MTVGSWDEGVALRWAQERLRDRRGDHTPITWDTPVTISDIAELAGVSRSTAVMWRQRSRPDWRHAGRLTVPMPPNPPELSERVAGVNPRPRWYLRDIMRWLYRASKWGLLPNGSVFTVGRLASRAA